MCPHGADFSLQLEVRRMNEHIKASHIGHGTISREEFERLELVLGSKSGRHKSYVEHSNRPALILDSGFRSESLFESRVGLLKSCVFHDGEEEQCVVNATFFSPEKEKNAILKYFDNKSPHNQNFVTEYKDQYIHSNTAKALFELKKEYNI